jgi:hypothetical protein
LSGEDRDGPPPMKRPRVRKLARIAGYAGAVLVLLAIVVAVGAPIYYRGARFGRLVEAAMPEMRGKVRVGGGSWSWGMAWALWRARPAAIALDDIVVTDPEGTEVLYARRATARVTIHRAPTRILIDDLVLDNARWRFARMKNERKVGFLATFEGVRRGRAPAAPGGSFELAIAGAKLDGVAATFDLPAWGLALRDVHGTGALAFKGKAFTFTVADAEVRGGGELRILGAKTGVLFPFERARLDRVATTADARDDIRLDASDIVTGRSRTSGGGVFTGVYGFTPASRHPGIELEARIGDAADAVGAMLARRGLAPGTTVTGRNAGVLLGFSGPFDQIAIDVEAHGFDVAGPRLEARNVGLSLTAEPLAGRFRMAKLEMASPEGGRLAAAARMDRLAVDGEVAFTRFSPRALLPAGLRRFVTGTMDGTVGARANLLLGEVELTRSTLVISGAGGGGKHPRPLALLAGAGARPPPGATVVRFSRAAFAGGAIRLPRVTLALAGGTVGAQGTIAIWDTDARRWLPAPRLALALDARGIDVQRLLGVGFAHGSLSFHARARGTPDDLALDVGFTPAGGGLTVLGERVQLPARAQLRLGGDGLVIESLPLGGPDGSTLRCAGRIATSGRLALDVGVRGFPIARLPGLAVANLPIGGAISGAVKIGGEPRAPAVSGEVTLAGVAFRGQPLGGGTLAITPERGGAIRARGRLIDAIAVDGNLTPRPSGLEGAVTLTLRALRLDPFLPKLPLGIVAGGVASGTLAARIAPGQPAVAEGRLGELSLTLQVPVGRRAASTRALSMHAEGDIVMAARTDTGLSLGPARLRGDLGAFAFSGRSRGDDIDATVRGRVELDALAPFARRWLDKLQGALDVDMSASRDGATGRIDARGSATVAAPIVARPAGLPVALGVAGGRVRLDGDTITTTALPVTVRAARFPMPIVDRLEASARVSARLDSLRGRPKLRAQTVVDKLELSLPLIGAKPVRSAGGEIDVEADLTTSALAITRVDIPVEAEIERLTAMTGVNVDRAKLALRLRGAPRKLILSGDVDVAAARVRADALGKAKRGARGGGGGGSSGGGALPGGALLEAMALDVRLRSRGGAVDVDVNNFPDLRVDLDMHVGGTVKRPVLTGTTRGAGLWSSFVLALQRLFS